jgi:hypothetical protein
MSTQDNADWMARTIRMRSGQPHERALEKYEVSFPPGPLRVKTHLPINVPRFRRFNGFWHTRRGGSQEKNTLRTILGRIVEEYRRRP